MKNSMEKGYIIILTVIEMNEIGGKVFVMGKEYFIIELVIEKWEIS